MTRTFWNICLISMLAVMLAVPAAHAQAENEDEGGFFYGEIISVGQGTVTVREITMEEEDAEEMTVIISEDTVLDTLEEGQALEEQMEVGVEYMVEDGETRAVYISVYTD